MTSQTRTHNAPAARGSKNQTVKRSASRRVVFTSFDTQLDSPKHFLSLKRPVSAVVEDSQRKKKFYRDRKRRKAAKRMMQRPPPPHCTNAIIMAAHSTPRMSLDLEVPFLLSQDSYTGVNFSGSFLPSLTAEDYASLFSVAEA